jgi:membrane protease YdiL (CAAX protease family)
MYRLAWTLYLFMALGGILWTGIRQGRIPVSLFIDLREWWLDLLLGVAAGLLVLAFWALTARFLPVARRLEEQLATVLGPLRAADAVALAVLSGFAEELFFRGAMQGSWGWLIATVLFALLHSGPGPAFRFWTLFAAVAGGLFGGLMAWRGNLLAPVVAHVLVNAVNLRRLASRPRDSVRLGSTEGDKET